MHFLSFVINLLAWTFIGAGLGLFLHKGVRTKQNGSVFIGAIASLGGGVFSSMSHGFPNIGVDFFNLLIAFFFSLIALYTFAPNTRVSITKTGIELIERSKRLIGTLSEGHKARSPYFISQFWKNITSSLQSLARVTP